MRINLSHLCFSNFSLFLSQLEHCTSCCSHQQTFKHMVSRTRYAITFSQFGIRLTRPIEQHVAVQETKKRKERPWKTNLWQFDFYSTCWNKTSGSKKQIQLQLFPGRLHLVRFITSNWFETFIILTAGENKLGLVSIILQFNKTFFYISSKALAKRFLLWNQLWNMLPKLWTRHQRKWGN